MSDPTGQFLAIHRETQSPVKIAFRECDACLWNSVRRQVDNHDFQIVKTCGRNLPEKEKQK